MPGSLSHLTRRFFDVLTARQLTPGESEWVRNWLGPDEAVFFFAQGEADQRHGYGAAMVVVDAGMADAVVIRAALLHDIGKAQSRLGVIGRSLASIAIRLRLPLTRRAALYRDHCEVAAKELVEAGCEPLIVDFARHHHDHRPESIPAATWDLLLLADQPPKARSRGQARISS